MKTMMAHVGSTLFVVVLMITMIIVGIRNQLTTVAKQSTEKPAYHQAVVIPAQ